MLDGLFPEGVITAFGDPLAPAKPLFPEEEALVARAVEKRRLEFAKGRECARSALASFGLGDAPLLAGETREPLWPADVVGSITHTRGLCAAAVARSARYRGIGIDAEPAEPLDDDLARRVCADEEAALSSSGLERGVVFRLVFSAKEAVYKCVFPITRRFLGFDDVHVRLTGDAFRAFLRVDSAPFRRGDEFEGRWRRIDEPAGA
ncbi:MAG TPA: 4'-phosphopantetheinyl transferase superfamily protein, partial [Polyangiaceae bacterium]